MRLVPNGKEWMIEGPGAERATVAYACVEGERLVYEFQPKKQQAIDPPHFAYGGARSR
jgi:hypothetical protein